MRQILATGKKSHHWPPEFGDVIAYCSAQHRISRLDRVENRALRDGSLDFEFHFAVNVGECAEMMWEYNADHGESKNPNNQNPSSKQIPNPNGKISQWEILRTWDLVLGTWNLFITAFGLRRIEQPGDRARLASSCLLNWPMHRLVRQSFQSKCRTAQANPRTS